MPTRSASAIVLVATLASSSVAAAEVTSAATASQAPRVVRRSLPARILLRAMSRAADVIATPLLTASERPVCGNVVSKGPPSRECTDSIGSNYFDGRASSDWTFTSRSCQRDGTYVTIFADGRTAVTTVADDGASTFAEVAAGAASTEPLVAACRRGLP